MKVMTVLGARPQFIKAATVSRVISATDGVDEVIVHTGQHFDSNMSEVFFEQLDIPSPHHHLKVGGLSHGAMTGRMVEQVEALIDEDRPDVVLVYGDTNSTLAATLAAVKVHVPVAHVEAGLRSANPLMPEELNRILTDRSSSLLFCPTEEAMRSLKREGFPYAAVGFRQSVVEQKMFLSGDVMFDAVEYYKEKALAEVRLEDFGVEEGFILCTLHRQENTDDEKRLSSILAALVEIAANQQLIMPLHPRTRAKLQGHKLLKNGSGIRFVEPMPYLEMQRLQMAASLILTDSGGVQKEAYFHGVPCVTLREQTEWVELVAAGHNVLVGACPEKIKAAVSQKPSRFKATASLYGNGSAASTIVEKVLDASS